MQNLKRDFEREMAAAEDYERIRHCPYCACAGGGLHVAVSTWYECFNESGQRFWAFQTLSNKPIRELLDVPGADRRPIARGGAWQTKPLENEECFWAGERHLCDVGFADVEPVAKHVVWKGVCPNCGELDVALNRSFSLKRSS